MKDVIGLVNCFSDPELGGLTSNRTLASTSFLGRYAFMDVVMSNFSNSGIDNIGVMVKNHQRSILKHMGNMSSWVNNTKTGKVTILTNENGVLYPAYNTDLNALKENDYILYNSQASALVFASPHIVATVDYGPILDEHWARDESVTVLYKKVNDADTNFLGGYCFEVSPDGYVEKVTINKGKSKTANVSLESWIMNRVVLAKIVEESKKHDLGMTIGDYLRYAVKNKTMKIHAYEYHGYLRNFNSLKNYIRYSFELLEPNVASTLFRSDWPIFTLTHNTPPALYGPHSSITNSFVSNGCQIDGSVSNSVICRNVVVGEGSKLNRCIVLSGVRIGENVKLSDVVIDKYAIITPRHTIEGDEENPIYLKQGAIL